MNNRQVARQIMQKVANRRQGSNHIDGLLKEAYLQGVNDGMEKVANRTYGDVIGDTNVTIPRSLFTPIHQGYDVGRLAGSADAKNIKAHHSIANPALSALGYGGLGGVGGAAIGAGLGSVLSGGNKGVTNIGGFVGGGVGLIAAGITLAAVRSKYAGILKDELKDVEISDRDKERAEERARGRFHLLNPLIEGSWSRGRGAALENIRHGKDPLESRGLIADVGRYGGLGVLGRYGELPIDIYDRVKAFRALGEASPLVGRLSQSTSSAESDISSGKRD